MADVSSIDDVVVVIRGRLARALLREPAVPTRWNERRAPPRVAVEVLPDQRRRVSGLVQPHGKRVGVIEQGAAGVVADVGPRVVPAGEDRRAGRAAERRRRDRVREPHPVATRILELGLEPRHGGWLGREGVEGLAVRQDDQDVRSGVGDGRPLAGARQSRHRERSERQREGQRAPQERSFRTFQMCSPGKSRAHASGAKSIYVVSASADGRSSMRSSIVKPLARNRRTHSP